MKIPTIVFSLAVLGLAASPALADHHMAKAIKQTLVKVGDGMQKVLTDSKGMTLYTFDKDKAGVSNCNGDCAKKWPPMMATAKSKGEGDFTVIKRSDGSPQWAFKGKALYGWFKDKKAGDATGDGVKGVWHVAKP